MHNRYITVIKNNQGMRDYEYGIDASPHFNEFELEEDEFETIALSGFWQRINEKCELLIDDYESEMIPNNKIDECISIYDELKLSQDSVLYKALVNARSSVALALDF